MRSALEPRALHTTIVFENPADYSIRGTHYFQEDLSDHGSVFGTSAFKRLLDSVPLSTCTFAGCRVGLIVT